MAAYLPSSGPNAQSWLPQVHNVPNVSANSVESFASQMPLAYHLNEHEHYSPAPSYYGSPATQYVEPVHQQGPYDLSINRAPSYGYQQQQNAYPYMENQQKDSYYGHGRMHEYHHGPQHFAGPQGYSDYPQPSQTLAPAQNYGGQGDFMRPQSPYPVPHMRFNQSASQYGPPQQVRHDMYGLINGGEYQNSNGGYGPAYDIDRSSSQQYNPGYAASNYGSEDEPQYKSSGFVPDTHRQNLQRTVPHPQGQKGKQSSNIRSGTKNFPSPKMGQTKPRGEHYGSHRYGQYHPQSSGLSKVTGPFQEPVYVYQKDDSVSTATSTNVSPRTGSRVTGGQTVQAATASSTNSPSKDKAQESETQSRNNSRATPNTPPTIIRATENATPLLRSRKGQSVKALKIDPVRGPPPAFLPSFVEQAVADPGPSIDSVLHENNQGFIAGGIGPDPFMSTCQSPTPVFRAPNQPSSNAFVVPTNPFMPVQPGPGALAPLIIPQSVPQGPSPHLASIAPNGMKPSIEVALDASNLPFIETARLAKPTEHGVIKITNIPYSVTRAEIVAFLGRNARILSEADEPIHIIMERVTSKTMEAYVEFVDINEAVMAVERYELNKLGGRAGRLGERHVELEVSGQDKLMRDLFPKAQNVKWKGAVPTIIPVDPNDQFNSGFKGFISSEELVMLVKHVESPQRSPFSKTCPQRPYECLITTLLKYPWYMVDYTTLDDRDRLFEATRDLVMLLVNRLNDNIDENIAIHLNDRLLRRVSSVIFRCPGFTEQQKDDIAFLCGLNADRANLAPHADHWTVFKTIGPKPGVERDVLNYYVALIREATTSAALVSLADRDHKTALGNPNFFGNVIVNYPHDPKKMTLGQIAKVEWNTIEALLRKILQR